MKRRPAAIGTGLFFLLGPGTVAGLLPWWLTGWKVPDQGMPVLLVRAVVSVILLTVGSAVLLSAFARFVREGAGTPAPLAPTDRLVVGGTYRYVRNPMYLAVVAVLLGQSVLFASTALLVYTGVVWAVMAAFVRWYEEPVLTDRYGSEYEEYRRHVRAWLPRSRPWTAPTADR
jgi:protein-S-isoprenylcysteine O-methyltransferase Ste14